MAVPDSLTAWREFAARRNVEPERLNLEEIAALSVEEKAAYDDSRFAWIGADVVIETKDLAAIEHQVHVIRARLSAQRSTAGRTLALPGRAGVGKSTIAMLMGKRHERIIRQQLGIPADSPDAAPALYLVVPPGSTRRCSWFPSPDGLVFLSPAAGTLRRSWIRLSPY